MSEPTKGEFDKLPWSVYATILAASVAIWVLGEILFGATHGFASAAFTGLAGGLAMCATMRWRARRGGRWHRSRTQ